MSIMLNYHSDEATRIKGRIEKHTLDEGHEYYTLEITCDNYEKIQSDGIVLYADHVSKFVELVNSLVTDMNKLTEDE